MGNTNSISEFAFPATKAMGHPTFVFTRTIALGAVAVLASGTACVSGRKPVAQDVAGPEGRAIAFLAREVPRWAGENNCYSCHNNGDGARALYAAVQRDWPVPAAALADTTRWLQRPEQWEHNGGEGEFSDKKLARIQFAAALTGAMDAGRIKGRGALLQAARDLVADQADDGAWRIDGSGSIGSPATYGVSLSTHMARSSLHRADPERFKAAIAKADAWLRQHYMQTVLDAAGALLALRGADDAAAMDQRRRCLNVIRQGQADDGGWGPYVTSPPQAFDTAIVLLSLKSVASEPDVETMMRRGRAYLVRAQLSDGSWPETTRPPGAVSYAQRISTTGWATLALLSTPSEP